MQRGRRRRGEFLIERLDQLEVMASPVRHEIHQTVDLIGPCSVREIAGRMARQPETLYYHIHQMIEAGLLVVIDEQKVGRRVEKVLDVAGRPFRVAPDRTDSRFLDSINRSVTARLRLAQRRVQTDVVSEDAVRGGSFRSWRLEQNHARLNRENRKRLNRMLDEIVDFLRENDDPRGELILTTLVTSRVGR